MIDTMTDKTSSTAGTQYPESLGFGFAELVALLQMAPGDGTEASAEALRLTEELKDVRCVSAGASSLVARGLATASEDGELSISGPVAATAHTLGTARRWVEITLLAPDRNDHVFTVDGAEYSILLQPRAQYSWFVMARNPTLGLAEGDFSIAKAHLASRAQAGVSFLNRSDPDHMLLLRRADEPERYIVGLLAAGAEQADESGPLDESQVVARLREFRGDAP